MEYFSIRFKELRLERGFSLNFIAKSIHSTVSTLRKWENNTSEPKIFQFYLISLLLNVNPEYLLGLTNIKTNHPKFKQLKRYGKQYYNQKNKAPRGIRGALVGYWLNIVVGKIKISSIVVHLSA